MTMTQARKPVRTAARSQRGVFLIEALLGILIFSLGILSLVAMQTAAVSAQSDARYRIEAANFADQIVSEMWLNANRPAPANAAATQASVAAYAHQASGAANSCNFSGTTSANAVITNWVAAVTAAATGLPGATAAMQQIAVTPVTDGFGGAAYSLVSVTVCWQAPIDATPHRHTVVALIS
jgi:type IV pilus assembly protein PilV